MYRYQNPVIPGFNPDPSVCRDGEDFYLVTSTFEFFPAVPIYHSRNLVDWELIGHCLDRPEQVPLEGCRASGGIYAPTIRRHDGVFYMTTTNTTGGGNVIVHTKDISGPWSNPVYVDQRGIDPSLLFIDNRTYFCSTGMEDGRQGIFLCDIDPLTGAKKSPSTCISFGCGGRFPEAPHLYFIDGWYYLMLAEGGTEYGHMVTIQRSRDIYGPYEPCPHNPILSHRNRGGHPIQATGHADLFEDQNGAWWLVCLGIRPLDWAMLHNLGRETFLVPVKWLDGWPVAGNGGTIELEMEGPLPASPAPSRNFDFTADFSRPNLAPQWNFIRNPEPARYRQEGGRFTITGSEKTLSSPNTNPAFAGVRQPAFEVEAVASIPAGDLKPGTRAGITAYYNHNHHYDLGLERSAEGNYAVILNKRLHDMEQESRRAIAAPQGGTPSKNTGNELRLRIRADREQYRFSFCLENGAWQDCGGGMTAGLCTEGTGSMTFTGVYIGLFSTGGAANFSSFTLRGPAD
jgi:alpha-N-arabinofuranosidase